MKSKQFLKFISKIKLIYTSHNNIHKALGNGTESIIC